MLYYNQEESEFYFSEYLYNSLVTYNTAVVVLWLTLNPYRTGGSWIIIAKKIYFQKFSILWQNMYRLFCQREVRNISHYFWRLTWHMRHQRNYLSLKDLFLIVREIIGQTIITMLCVVWNNFRTYICIRF